MAQTKQELYAQTAAGLRTANPQPPYFTQKIWRKDLETRDSEAGGQKESARIHGPSGYGAELLQAPLQGQQGSGDGQPYHRRLQLLLQILSKERYTANIRAESSEEILKLLSQCSKIVESKLIGSKSLDPERESNLQEVGSKLSECSTQMHNFARDDRHSMMTLQKEIDTVVGELQVGVSDNLHGRETENEHVQASTRSAAATKQESTVANSDSAIKDKTIWTALKRAFNFVMALAALILKLVAAAIFVASFFFLFFNFLGIILRLLVPLSEDSE